MSKKKEQKKIKKKKAMEDCCLSFIKKGRKCKDCPLREINENK